MQIVIDIVERNAAAIRKSDMNLMVKRGYENAGRFWHANYRKRHFERGAFQRYSYTPRSRAYSRRKMKYLGHMRPLVFSGRSFDLSKQKTVRATRNGVRVSMPTNALNFRAKNSKVDMRDELTQRTPQEQSTIATRMRNELTRRLNTFTKTKRMRIK